MGGSWNETSIHCRIVLYGHSLKRLPNLWRDRDALKEKLTNKLQLARENCDGPRVAVSPTVDLDLDTLIGDEMEVEVEEQEELSFAGDKEIAKAELEALRYAEDSEQFAREEREAQAEEAELADKYARTGRWQDELLMLALNSRFVDGGGQAANTTRFSYEGEWIEKEMSLESEV